MKYKPEFPYSEFKKPVIDLEYVINEADIYDEVDAVGKLFNFNEQKVSNAENKDIECTIVDATNRERLLKIFGDQLVDKVKDNLACKLTDLKAVLGSNQRKVLHTTSSTTCIDVDDKNIAGIVPKEIKLLNSKLATLEGTVISTDMPSLTAKHSYPKCSTFVETDSGLYCCPSCNMMGTMESVTTSKPNISFYFKDIESNKQFQVDASVLVNFTGHAVLNKVKLAKHLCKMPSFFVLKSQIMLSLVWH